MSDVRQFIGELNVSLFVVSSSHHYVRHQKALVAVANNKRQAR